MTEKNNINFSVKIPTEEVKSKHINFKTKPSTYEAVQKKCKDMGISVNELINQFFENFIL